MKPLYLLLTFCTGLCLGYVLFEKDPLILKPSSLAAALTMEATATDNLKKKAEHSLKQQNEFLREQLAITDQRLKQNRVRLDAERRNMLRLRAVLFRDSAFTENPMADSLSQHIDTLTTRTDSLLDAYQAKIGFTESTIAVRDSELVVCQWAYTQLSDLTKEQTEREQQLTVQLNTALKQQQQKRWQNRFLAGGMVFLSGFVTTLLIHGKY